MPTFDRFDICDAYHCYAALWHGGQGSDAYKILGRLSAIKYVRRASLDIPGTENAREIYCALVESSHKDSCGYNDCSCRDCFETAIGVPGIAMCSDCAEAGCEYGEHECLVERAYGADSCGDPSCKNCGDSDESDSDESEEAPSAPQWAYGNGMPGCLFDHVSGPYESASAAAAGAAELLELTDAERDELAADHIIYFRGDRFHEVGAGMVQLFEVDAKWIAAEEAKS